MGWDRDIITGAGRISVISTSKIRKITAIKKNRSENGRRLGLLGSNPHSNGDGFSRSWIAFLQMAELMIISAVASPKDRTKTVNIKVAINKMGSLVGGQTYFYITTLS